MADQLNIEGRIQKAVANGKDKNDENNAYATKPDDKQVLPQSLEKFVDLKSQRSTEVELKEWTTTEKMDRSLDLDIYDDLDEIKSQGSTKIVEKERSLDLDIYDDLDDFQKAEDHKTKELLAWEVKYEKAQAEIQDLKIENKALGKKIKTMEVNLQNLLDTAKAEVKRKEALIAQLRKEKDDLCFRRKRGREVDEKGEKGQESKRIKECQSNAQKNSETDRNPFKTASKNDTRKANFKNDEKMTKTREDTKKSIIRTNYPELGQPKTNEQRSSTHNHYSGKGHRSRDRRHSRSRSPKHSSRLDTRSSKCSARQVKRGSRSQSPRINLPEEKPQATAALLDEANDSRSESPQIKLAKLETGSSKKVASNERNTSTNSIFIPKDSSEVCKSKHAIIPGLHLISKSECAAFVPNDIEPVEMIKPVEKLLTISNHSKDSASEATKHCKKEEQQLNRLANESQAREPLVKFNKKTNLEIKDVLTTKKPETVDQPVCKDAATAYKDVDPPSIDNIKAGSGTDEHNHAIKLDAGIQIIEDIRLPKMADIDHIAVKVDKQCKETSAISDSKVQNIDLFVKTPENCNSRFKELKDQEHISSAVDTPIKSSTILYAKPDSTKLDHNDENDEVILEAAMNLLMNEQEPSSIVDPSYTNLSNAEDTIEMALEQLHQQSPDETVVTSTSNRAQQTPKLNLITILTQSPNQCSPSKSKAKSKKLSPKVSPEKTTIEKTPLKKRKLNIDSPTEAPSVAKLDLTIDESLETSLGNDASTITKRCSLGHTDYQYEQIKDEVILRVKRRCRRRRPVSVDIQTPNAVDQAIK